jgi:hypothetical protein
MTKDIKPILYVSLTHIGFVETLNESKTKLRALLRKSEIERELDEELGYHIGQMKSARISDISPGRAVSI